MALLLLHPSLHNICLSLTLRTTIWFHHDLRVLQRALASWVLELLWDLSTTFLLTLWDGTVWHRPHQESIAGRQNPCHGIAQHLLRL